MNNHRILLQEVGEYFKGLSLLEVDSIEASAREERFVDEMTDKFSLNDENEAALSVSLSMMRALTVLISGR